MVSRPVEASECAVRPKNISSRLRYTGASPSWGDTRAAPTLSAGAAGCVEFSPSLLSAQITSAKYLSIRLNMTNATANSASDDRRRDRRSAASRARGRTPATDRKPSTIALSGFSTNSSRNRAGTVRQRIRDRRQIQPELQRDLHHRVDVAIEHVDRRGRSVRPTVNSTSSTKNTGAISAHGAEARRGSRPSAARRAPAAAKKSMNREHDLRERDDLPREVGLGHDVAVGDQAQRAGDTEFEKKNHGTSAA